MLPEIQEDLVNCDENVGATATAVPNTGGSFGSLQTVEGTSTGETISQAANRGLRTFARLILGEFEVVSELPCKFVDGELGHHQFVIH